jgi:hypothetical protein
LTQLNAVIVRLIVKLFFFMFVFHGVLLFAFLVVNPLAMFMASWTNPHILRALDAVAGSAAARGDGHGLAPVSSATISRKSATFAFSRLIVAFAFRSWAH